MHLCTCVSKEGGDGEDTGSEVSSLLSYTLRYISLAELGTLYRVGFREPMYLYACVSEEGGDGEDGRHLLKLKRHLLKLNHDGKKS